MRLYLDTSALVKLYLEEEGAVLVRTAVERSQLVATSSIGYVEARAAFARRSREGVLSAQGYRTILRQFNAEWGRYLHLDVTDAIIKASGDIAEKYHLRAYDAIHLTSAIVLKDRLSARVVFASWDAALDVAARQSGLELLPKHPDPF